MKKLLAILLAVAMVMSMAVVVSAEQSNTVTVIDYDFSDGSVGAWTTHGGSGNLSVENGALLTQNRWNGAFTTACLLGTLTSGTTYNVTLDIYADASGIEVNGEHTFTVSIVSGGLDGTEYKVVDVSVPVSKWTTGTFEYTPTENVENAYLCVNTINNNPWSEIKPVFSIDNVKVTYTDANTAPADTTPHIKGLYFSASQDETILGTYIGGNNATGAYEFTHPLVIKWYYGDELLTETTRKPEKSTVREDTDSAPTLVYGNVNDEAVDGWLHASWTADVNKCPTKVELWADGKLVDTYNFDDHADEEGVIDIRTQWNSTYITGASLEGNASSPEETTGTYTGYFSTSDETHAIIIGDAIITSNHVFNANGDCVFCGHHVDVEEEVVEIETPVESETEEVDEDDVDVSDEEPEEDNNPTTGIALAIVPMMVAVAAVVASKRR